MTSLKKIILNVQSFERLHREDALILFHEADLMVLADLANRKRNMLHQQSFVSFVIDRNINYTNVCMSECRFCAFYRSVDDSEAYIISEKSLHSKITETIALGGTQLLLQGGMHPELELDYYLNLLKYIKGNFSIHIHGFSPPEIFYIARKTGMSIRKVVEALVKAGLDSIPGGGAEILVDEVREKLSPNKCKADQWLEVMRVAHKTGLKSTATMMFGHIETPEQLIEHLIKIRDLQDETNGFTAFIPWTFQPDNTQIHVSVATAAEYLRVLALSRLVLDNVMNIQASWVTQGAKIAQVALAFGANDFGSTMIEENVVAAAGVNYRLPKEEIVRLITDAGYTAVQRDCFYNRIHKYE